MTKLHSALKNNEELCNQQRVPRHCLEPVVEEGYTQKCFYSFLWVFQFDAAVRKFTWPGSHSGKHYKEASEVYFRAMGSTGEGSAATKLITRAHNIV